MIPKNITRDHVMKAMQEAGMGKMPRTKKTRRYYLEYDGNKFPTRYLVSIANIYANGKALENSKFASFEAYSFLKSLGFKVVDLSDKSAHTSNVSESYTPVGDTAPGIMNYLNEKYSIKINKETGFRSGLVLPSGSIIHVSGSKLHDKTHGFYALTYKKYRDLVSRPKEFYAISLEGPEHTFVLPGSKVRDIFSEVDPGSDKEWHYRINKLADHYILRPTNDKREISSTHHIEEYLNRWDQIQDFDTSEHLSKHIFVTGYDQKNLEISKQKNILGWVNKSKFLSSGSLVFVFNKDTLTLETLFEIESHLADDALIWADELTAGKVIYNNRWKAKVLFDNVNIPLQQINSIPPFDKEKFQGLLRGNFPMPLDTPSNRAKYSEFRKILLERIKSVPNCWIFVVIDQESINLPAEQIYRTRMNDKFWGLDEGTPYRKSLKKGDIVIFSHGSKTFLGTASLGSDTFELDDQQKNGVSHNIDFYKAGYGVFLENIVTWPTPKQVKEYANSLSFVSNASQYPVYFQGGIKKITPFDYNLIVGGITATTTAEEIETEETFEDAPLAEPDKSMIEEALQQIDDKLLVNKNSVMQIVINLLSGRHIIIAGPVGTGKTTLANLVSELFWKDDRFSGYFSDIYTATADWNSQDVIGGIMPRIKADEPTYEIVLGCVSDTVLNNWSITNSKYRTSTTRNGNKFKGIWLVIDEFNRADIDKALGQLFTALETRILKIPDMSAKSGYEERKIPLDYRIIGTLNTADKHYLFKLSDALKRRFAFVEISPPGRGLRNTEIYYALKNALAELDGSYYQNLLILDNNNKIVDVLSSDKRLVDIIEQAYEILDLVRMTKPLGTAILKSIYKTMLVGIKITDDYGSSLDIAINSNLVSQLESIGVTSLETLFSILFGDVIDFFKKKQMGNERDQYQNDFRNFLILIGSNRVEERSKEFLQQINTDVWNSIEKYYLPYKKDNQCELFKSSLLDLVKSSMT